MVKKEVFEENKELEDIKLDDSEVRKKYDDNTEQNADFVVDDELKQKDNDILDKLKEYEDRYLRLQADFDNYKKRTERDKQDFFAYALEDLMLQLIPVIDNFERALDSFEKGNIGKDYIDGLKMVYRNFIDTLNKNGLEEIDALNCVFDPNYHHAAMQVEANDEDENLVKDVFQKGYTLKAKVIRPCMVKVAIKN